LPSQLSKAPFDSISSRAKRLLNNRTLFLFVRRACLLIGCGTFLLVDCFTLVSALVFVLAVVLLGIKRVNGGSAIRLRARDGNQAQEQKTRLK